MSSDTSNSGSEPAHNGPDRHSETPPPSSDSVAEIDGIVGAWSERRSEEAERNAQAAAEREQFVSDFMRISDSVIRPTMQSAADRLEKDGGGGLVETHQADATHGPRIVLWMSLEGSISGEPREDHNPYLRLDADIPHRSVAVWEGDMWQNKGASGPSMPLVLSDITSESVTELVLGILRRATSHEPAT